MVRILVTWLLLFIDMSALDALWHLVLFKQTYVEGLMRMGRTVNGRLKMQALPGLLSQVLVVSAVMVLALDPKPEAATLLDGLVRGALGGILAISVYGLVNLALIRDWGLSITLLEVVWGPMIGAMGGALGGVDAPVGLTPMHKQEGQ